VCVAEKKKSCDDGRESRDAVCGDVSSSSCVCFRGVTFPSIRLSKNSTSSLLRLRLFFHLRLLRGFSFHLGFCLCFSGLILFFDLFHLCTFRLSLVDELDEHTLILILVTLCLLVKGVVDVLVDLLLLTVLSKQPSQHSRASDPQDLTRRTRVLRTLPLTNTGVPSLALCLQVLSHARAGVDFLRLTHDETILEELADGKTAVGHADFLRLIWVKIYPILTTLLHRRGESFFEVEAT